MEEKLEIMWQVLLATIIVAAVIGLGVVLFAPKNVDYYYISSENSSVAFCAWAHWTWHVDEKAYCTCSKDDLLDFVAQANASTLKHR